jgi:hypothetical protein
VEGSVTVLSSLTALVRCLISTMNYGSH